MINEQKGEGGGGGGRGLVTKLRNLWPRSCGPPLLKIGKILPLPQSESKGFWPSPKTKEHAERIKAKQRTTKSITLLLYIILLKHCVQ